MEIKYTISAEEYQRLKNHSAMLGRIASVVRRYAHTPQTTTYECVLALNERERKLSAKVQAHKNAGGKFLGENA
jgi:hypothetical protein